MPHLTDMQLRRANTSPYPLVTARHTDSMGTNKATRERLNANRILP